MARLTAAQRKRSATVKTKGPGGKTQYKFPMPDKAHARNALARLNQAKPPLSKSQKSKVRAKAKRILGKGRGR